LIVIGVNVFLQLTGQNFSTLYGTTFIKSLGTVNPFTMTSVNTGVNIFTVLVTQALTDITGRVPLMTAGAALQMMVLFTMGGLGTAQPQTNATRQGIVAMLTVFGVGFQLGWAPLSHVVAAEVPTNKLRDATYALGSVFNILIQFTVSFSIPYLLDDKYAGLQSRVGFIFGSTAFCALIFSIFCIPECSGKTVEEIDELFIERVPIRKFGQTRPRICRAPWT
jgi:MFS transporter, SP family, sugar:H+ symporter